MKKRCLIFILTVIFAISAAITFVGCQSADRNDIQGTYEMTEWSKYYEDNVATDIIERDGVKAYIVITGEDRGFYVYSDNSTPLYCKQVELTYDYSSSDPDKLIKVTLKDGLGVSMSFTTSKTSTDVKLKDHKIKFLDQKESMKVFTRISKKTDLSTVNEKVGQTLTYVDFEDAPFDCLYEYVYDVSDSSYYEQVERYVYYFVKLDVTTNKATVYYCKKSDLVQNTVVQDIVIDKTNNTLTVGSDVFAITYDNGDCFFSQQLTFNEGEEDQFDATCWLSRIITTADIDTLCSERLDDYKLWN
ncbi:MAG: hypothetical protein ACI4MI_02325 [Christensenellales bacterium]